MNICPSDDGLHVLGWASLGGGMGMGVIGRDDSTKCCHRARINIVQRQDESPKKDQAMIAALRQAASGGFSGKMRSLLMNVGTSNAARAMSARQ
jgi:hypothetical protein